MLLGFSLADFCSKTSGLLTYVGWILTIVKIAIPFIIIGLGIFDLGKAVVSSADDQIKKSTKTLLWRIVAGIVIFFIPTIVLWLFTTIDEFKNNESSIDRCEQCILYPWKCDAPTE